MDQELLSLFHLNTPQNPQQLPIAMRTNSKPSTLADKSLHSLAAARLSSWVSTTLSIGHHVPATLVSFQLLKEHTSPFLFSAQKALP